MKRLLYLILKRDMIKKLSEKHGEQFIDDVMETFKMPTNILAKRRQAIPNENFNVVSKENTSHS